MCIVTIPDVRNRQSALNRLECKKPFLSKGIEEIFNKKYSFRNAKLLLENWTSLSYNTELAFDKTLNILESIWENGNNGEFTYASNYILEEVVPMVRDGSQIANLIKIRTRRFKTKISTKINNATDSTKSAVSDSIEKIKNALPSTTTQQSTNGPEEEKMESVLNQIQESINKYIQCDRVIKNNESLSKRFNINNILSECYTTHDVKDCINTLCECIDTYDSPFKMKYNVALEQINYNLTRAGIKFDKALMIEQITDFFIKDTLDESKIEDINYILSNNKFFNESELSEVQYIIEAVDMKSLSSSFLKSQYDEVRKIGKILNEAIELDSTTVSKLLSRMNTIIGIGKEILHSCVKDMNRVLKYIKANYKGDDLGSMAERAREKAQKKLRNNEMSEMQDQVSYYTILRELSKRKTMKEATELETYVENSKIDEVKKLLNEYKLKKEKSPEDLRGMISKLYTKSPNLIINDMPSILSWIRFTFVLSTFQISAVVGFISILVDQFIKLHLSRKETDRMIKHWKDELSFVETKLSRTKDKEIIDRLTAYKIKLTNGISSMETYANNLLSDKERSEKYDDDDFDFDLEAATIANNLKTLSESYDNAHTKSQIKRYLSKLLKENIEYMSNTDIDIITEFYYLFPDCISRDELLESYDNEIYRCKGLIGRDRWERSSCIRENINIINNTPLPKQKDIDEINLSESVLELNVMNEMINVCSEPTGAMNESMTSTLKLAMNKLKKTAVKLSDKEKSISRTIDASLNTLSRSAERAVRNDNREAIIKGSIIPSASKIIKGAIVSGAVAFINPAVAVIGVLGTLACSKKMKSRERQYILDEIEIELKMCDRYLRQAEDNNDLDAQKMILTTQRNLERQRQRIKYKMTVYHRRDVPNVNKNDDED